MGYRDTAYSKPGAWSHFERSPSPGGPWTRWSGPYYRASVTIDSYRDESHPTTKVGGVYVTPTTYGAHLFAADHNDFDYLTLWHGYRDYYRYRGKSSTDWAFAISPETYGCTSGVYPREPIIPASVYNKAVARAMARAMNYNSFNLGQTFGELRETIGFVSSGLVQLGSLLSAIRRGDLRAIRRFGGRPVTNAAQAHLAYQYGLKPLMSDIYDGLDLISNGLAPHARTSVTVEEHDPSFGPIPARNNGEINEIEGSFTRGVKIGYTFGISNPTLYSLSQYGLTDPLTLAWELLPLSFVVDWFTGAKNFIDSWTPPIGLTFTDGYSSKFIECRYTATYKRKGAYYYSGSFPKLTCRQSTFVRTRLLTWPGSTPYLKLELNPSQATSLAALAAVLK